VGNHVITTMGRGGKIKLVNTSGTVRLSVSVQGAYTSASTGSTFRPNPMRRVVTARTIGPKGQFTMAMKSLPTWMNTIALRVTIASASTNGSLSVCPGGTKKKACKASPTVPVQRHRVTTEVVMVKVGPGGSVKFFNAAGTTKVTVDVFGSFGRS
jgi:hypothetical protein